jgi:membrane protein
MALGAAAVYRFAPNRPDAPWVWISPGSAAATGLWLIATLAFGFYVSRFGNYNATYGSLGGVVVFLTWLYLSAFILLMGGELNSELERQQAPVEEQAAAVEDSPKPAPATADDSHSSFNWAAALLGVFLVVWRSKAPRERGGM